MDADKIFSGSIPALYDRYMGPLLFAPYAAEMAARMSDRRPLDVLEIAAGTGVLTRALLPVLSGESTLIATDLNQPMLDYAARRIVDSRLSWKQADAQALPFADCTFDRVICQFGAMFFPDKIGAYAEARRVLRPGGRILFSVWDRIEENVFGAAVTRALAAVFPDDPPRFLARVPHGYHDTDRIRRELDSAGLVAMAVDAVVRESRAASAAEVAIGFCQGTPFRNEIEARDPTRLAPATASVEAALSADFGRGPVAAMMRAYVVTAVRPA